MSDMTKDEIEDLARQISHPRGAHGSQLEEWCLLASSALRQLMNEQKWRKDIDEAKTGLPVLITDGNWSCPARWDETGDPAYPWWILDPDGDDNRAKESSVIGWRPLPSPPETSDE